MAKKPIYQALSCNETGVEFYRCQIPKVNAVTPSKGIETIIKSVTRFLGLTKKTFNPEMISKNGRTHTQEYFVIAYPEDVLDLKVGDKCRFNSTKVRQKVAFNPNLKPFIYDITKKDIVDLEIKEIKNYGMICGAEHIEIHLTSY
ncbi:MAG: hypothetical protein ACRCZ2_10040 [Fusobacteriaceae bacterium]